MTERTAAIGIKTEITGYQTHIGLKKLSYAKNKSTYYSRH